MSEVLLEGRAGSLNSETVSDRLGDQLNSLSNILQKPFWYCEERVHRYSANPLNEAEIIGSTASRILVTYFSGVGALYGLIPAFWGCMIKGASNFLKSQEYLYIEGKGEEVQPVHPKFLHLNACMFPGSLPLVFGGVRPASERMDELKAFIRERDPDTFFLCEFSQQQTSQLVADHQGNYRHIFANIGSNAMGMDASMVVVSREFILRPPQFIPSRTIPEGDQKASYRGYFHVETDKVHYIYTHLHPKETDRAREIRQEQLDEILEIAKDRSKPWVILGDINIKRNTEGYRQMLKKGFNDMMAAQHEDLETCINGLERGVKEDPESIDMVLVLGEVEIQTEIYETYENPRHALSDHKGIGGTIV